MNYFAPGLRELARILDRLVCRGRLPWQRRELARLESKLGLLGWQQADYDADTQEHVNRLAECERAQAELTNESAAVGLAIQQLEERRAGEQAAFESQRTDRNAAREPLLAPVAESESALAAKQREREEIRKRIPALDREKVADEEKYRLLLAKGDHSPTGEAAVQHLQRRVIANPREKQEWQEKLAAMETDIPRLETELQQRRALLAVETDALHALEKSHAESDGELVREITARKREKQKLEKRINDLEKAKTQPYREIGRALADQHIEPINQPNALAAVLAQRERIGAQELRLAASLEASAQEKRTDVWASWLLLLTFAVLIWGVIWFGVKGI